MSATIPQSPATPRDRLIADAKNVPSLLASAQASDPSLYAMLTGGNTKNVWYAPVVGGVSWLAGRYALGWDAGTCDAVAGVIVFVGTALVHYLTPKLLHSPTPPIAQGATP